MDLSRLLGNEALKARLAPSFDRKRTSHSYLLCGPAGSGRKTLATVMAAAFQCRDAAVPCGVCPQCRKVFGGIHPDVIIVDDAEKKHVPIDLIREMRSDAYIRPNEGAKKIYIIPRAQDMQEPAQNALLKIIEEPPPYGVFLLLAENAQRILPTVRSRCAELRLEPVPTDQALVWLTKKHPDKAADDLRAALRRSGGYLGQADTLLQKDMTLPQTEQFAKAFPSGNKVELVRLLCSMERLSRDALSAILRQWLELLADALLCRSGIAVSRQAAQLANACTAKNLMSASNLLQKAIACCDANVGSGHICGWLAANL